MPKNMPVVLYIVVLIAVVVSVDVLFFRNLFWERLIVNIGIVVVFAAFYLRIPKAPVGYVLRARHCQGHPPDCATRGNIRQNLFFVFLWLYIERPMGKQTKKEYIMKAM